MTPHPITTELRRLAPANRQELHRVLTEKVAADPQLERVLSPLWWAIAVELHHIEQEMTT